MLGLHVDCFLPFVRRADLTFQLKKCGFNIVFFNIHLDQMLLKINHLTLN